MTVAIDAGRTTCRVAWYAAGRRDRVVEHPAPATITDPGGAEAVLATVRLATAELALPTDVGTVVAGFAGLLSQPEAAEILAQGLSAVFPVAHVQVTSDIVTAHAGALGGAPGVVLAAGTGATAFAVTATGRWALVDGWGHLLGDAGSGFAVGRAGLAAALRHHDGRGGSADLAGRARRRFGDLRGVVARLRDDPAPVRTIASFSPEVAAAALHGDPCAAEIWGDAARELATSAAAAARRTTGDAPVAVSWAGGLFRAGDLLVRPLRETLSNTHRAGQLVPPAGDALDGGATLAGPDTCHAPLLAAPRGRPAPNPDTDGGDR